MRAPERQQATEQPRLERPRSGTFEDMSGRRTDRPGTRAFEDQTDGGLERPDREAGRPRAEELNDGRVPRLSSEGAAKRRNGESSKPTDGGIELEQPSTRGRQATELPNAGIAQAPEQAELDRSTDITPHTDQNESLQ
jgi:hypothetical protein